MWRRTYFRPLEFHSLDLVDDSVNTIVQDIYSAHDITEDWTGHTIQVIVFETRAVDIETNMPRYAYRFWLDGVSEVLPGPTPGFLNSLVDTYEGLLPEESSVTVTIEQVAALLEQQFGHEPVAIRRYAVVTSPAPGAELVVNN